MNQAGELQRILLVTCILLSIFVLPVAAGEMRDPTDDSTRIPILNETVATTTTTIPADLLVISTLPNMAPVNPAYLRYQEQQQRQQQTAGEQDSLDSLTGSSVIPVSSHATGAIPLYEDLSYLKGTFVVDDTGVSSSEKTMLKEALPAKYDLRTLGRVSPVKNQGDAGVCWAFATVASLESTLLPGEIWDFSENNMKNLLSDLFPEGFDRNFSKGGTHKMSTAYLARWTGPVNQSDDPYNATSPYSPPNLTVEKHVQRVVYIPDRVNLTDNNNIKTAVWSKGAVYTTYNMSDNTTLPYWNETHNSYYYFGDAYLNHAVAIAGWDDSWSRNNFTTTPPGDGAFIIKNSWGTGWGDGGYFYCSYYDKLIGNDNAQFISDPPTNYNHIYQYDPLGWVSSMYTVGEKRGLAANVFNCTRNETLSAVSFYTTDTGTAFEISVYVNPNNGPVLNSSGARWTTNGTFPNAGYHTVPIPVGIPLDSNDRFSVAVNFTNPSYNWSIPLQYWTSETTKAKAYPGQGYISSDGSTWTDVTEGKDDKNTSICIKAFTRDPTLVADFTATPRSGMAPLNVSFSDLSTGSPIAWNWSFGDGSSCTQQNPLHTYTQPGSYTVSLNATNAMGSTIAVKTGYIFVQSDNPAEMFRANPQHTGVYDDGGVRPTSNVMWNFKTNGPVYSSPTISGDVLYIGSNDKNVYAINATTGDEIWHYATGAHIDSSPAVADGVVYIGSWDRNIYALDAATGAKIWNFTTEGEVRASPTVVNGIVYVGSIGNQSLYNPNATSNFYAINAVTGTKIWNYSTSYEPRSSPAVANGLVYFGTFDRYLYALNASTGAEVWTFTAGEFVDSSPAVANGIVYVGSGDTSIYAINATTGDEIWHYDTGGWVESSPAVANGVVYIGSKDTRVYALNATTGTKIWDYPTGAAVLSSPAVANGIVYVGSLDKNVYALNAATGAKLWSFTTGSYVFSSPAVANGAVYFGSWDHNIYALGGSPPAPVANFAANVTTGTAPLPVRFTDTSTNTPTGWAWFFGDETYTEPWTLVNPAAGWSARGYHSSVVMQDGSIILTGGRSYNTSFRNDTWRSTDYGVTWTEVNASSGWSARCYHSSVAMPDNSIILTGGWDGSSKNDTWRSIDYGATWTKVNASSGWSARDSHSSVVMQDGTIILTGGDASDRDMNDTWQSTDNGVTWTQVNTSSGWSARDSHSSAAMPDGSIVLTGGWDGSSKNDTWRSTDKGVTWIQANVSPGWLVRDCHSSVAMQDGSIVIIGGWDGIADMGDVWRSTDTGTTWVRINASGGATARDCHTSVAMPDGSIVLSGGWFDGTFRNDTWRFVPTGSSAQNPTHTYAKAGIYPVTLTAANAGGSNSLTKTGYITVSENPSNRPRLILSDESHYQNTVTSTPVRVMNLTNGIGISFNLTYDPSIIRVNEITLNESYVSGSSLEVNATPGLIRLSLTRTEPIMIGSPVPLFFLNTTGTGPVGASTPLNFSHATWSTPAFDSQPMDTVNGSILIYRIRGDLNGNGWVDIGDTAKTAYMVVKLTPDLLPDADFNNNGVIDTGDATKIACYLVGRIPAL
jgi:C1A family cysteine protease/outer membrane protein assembly factor BamB